MFTPPEIPLSGYVPPKTDVYLPPSTSSTSYYPHQFDSAPAPLPSAPQTDYYRQPSPFASSAPPFASSAPSFASSAPPFASSAPQQDFYRQQTPICKKVDPSHIYTQQQGVQNFTPKPFTPSPISNEKLAVFEPARKHQPAVPIR